jgi:peptide/nickel transport system substrate-binding protein
LPTNPPTKDLKVRQAIAAAIDPRIIDQRANNGAGNPGSSLFQGDFKWDPGIPGPKYDPTAAKQYVAQAKAAGWDGKVRVLSNNTPVGQATGLAIDAMLKGVGIDDQLDIAKDAGQSTIQYVIQHDFDVVAAGFALSNDESGMVAIAQNLACNIPSNRIGFCDPALDQALKDVRAAKTDDQRKAGYKVIAQEVNAQLPMLVYAKVDQFQIWSPKVHGVTETLRDFVTFAKAWIEH